MRSPLRWFPLSPILSQEEVPLLGLLLLLLRRHRRSTGGSAAGVAAPVIVDVAPRKGEGAPGAPGEVPEARVPDREAPPPRRWVPVRPPQLRPQLRRGRRQQGRLRGGPLQEAPFAAPGFAAGANRRDEVRHLVGCFLKSCGRTCICWVWWLQWGSGVTRYCLSCKEYRKCAGPPTLDAAVPYFPLNYEVVRVHHGHASKFLFFFFFFSCTLSHGTIKDMIQVRS